MNYYSINTTAAPVEPAAYPIMFADDLEKGVAAVAVPLKSPHPKISIPHEPEASTTDPPSRTPASARTNYRRNRMIVWVFILMREFVFNSYTLSRKGWSSFTNIGGDSMEVNQLYAETYNKTAAVGSEYEQCPRDQGLQCRLRTSSDEAQERARLDSVHSVNQITVDAAQQGQTQCRRRASFVRGILHELVIDGHALPFVVNEAICPAATRMTILTKAGGDTEADLLDINDYVAQYIERSNKEFYALVDHANDTVAYNKIYFLEQIEQTIDTIIDKINDLEVSLSATLNLAIIKLRDAFQGFSVCIVPQKGSTVMCPVPSLSVRIDEIIKPLKDQFAYATALLKIAFGAIADLVDQYNVLRAALQSVADIFGKLREVFGVRPFDAAWSKFNGPDLRKFINLPDGGYFVPADIGSFPNFQGLASFTPIWNFFFQIANDFRNLLTAIMDELRADLIAGLGALRKAIEEIRVHFMLFEDYDPPNFPGTNSTEIGGLKIDKRAESAAFLDGVRARTNGLKTTAAFLPDPNTYVPPTSALDLTNVTSQVREPFTDLLDFHPPDFIQDFVPFFNWLRSIISNWTLSYMLEILIFRVWNAINQFNKYRDRNSIPISEVEVGQSHEQSHEKQPEQNRFVRLVRLLFHDRMKTLLTVLIRAAVASLVFVIGKAYYNHYHERCMIAKIGTDLTTGLIAPAVINQVLIKGDNAFGREIKDFKDRHVSLCSKAKSDSFWVQEQQQTKLFTIANDHEQNIAEVAQLLACIDFDALDGMRTGLYNELRSCMEPIDTALENGVAACDWSECEIQCDREEARATIHLAVVEGMCKVEYSVLSNILLCVGAFVQYLCLKFTGRLLLQAFLIAFWKKLRRPTIKLKYIYNLDEGRFDNMDDNVRDQATKAAIERHLKHERNQLYQYIAFIIVANVPWSPPLIYLIITRADTLRPKWL